MIKKFTYLIAIYLVLFFPLAHADFQKDKIAILDFRVEVDDIETKDMGAIISEWLTTEFVKAGRFEVVERRLLKEIMEEQKMVEYGLVDSKTAIQLGKILGVKAIISGSVYKLRDVIEVNARIIDVEKASIVAAENVKSENIEYLHDLVNDMSRKIINNFPLRGYIVHRDSDKCNIDLGSLAGVKEGMVFTVYKEGDVIKHPRTGEVLDVKHITTGEITIISVRPRISEGRIDMESEPDAIKYGQLVKSIIKRHNYSNTGFTVETTPPDARVRILNIVPKYEAGIVLDPGNYHIEVSAPGYITEKKWISLRDNTNKSITVSLTKMQAPYRVNIQTKPDRVAIASKKIQSAPRLPTDLQQYIKMLHSNYSAQKRNGARLLYAHYPTHPASVREANAELLKGHGIRSNDGEHVDAMAYLCNILGDSRDKTYKKTLRKVAITASTRKLRRYAEKNLRKLE